jgi:hypothetical protein
MVGRAINIRKVDSHHMCFAGKKCKKKTQDIYPGEVAVYAYSWSHPYNPSSQFRIPVFVYWHPKCFLDAEIGNEKGINIVKKIIITFLPLLIGEERAKPIVLALDIDTVWSTDQ